MPLPVLEGLSRDCALDDDTWKCSRPKTRVHPEKVADRPQNVANTCVGAVCLGARWGRARPRAGLLGGHTCDPHHELVHGACGKQEMLTGIGIGTLEVTDSGSGKCDTHSNMGRQRHALPMQASLQKDKCLTLPKCNPWGLFTGCAT